MKRLCISALLPLVLMGCERTEPEFIDNAGEQVISFVVEDPEATKAPQVVESISEFYVTATTGPTGREETKWANQRFSLDSGTGTFKSVRVWPATDPGYHFYGSNVQMTTTTASAQVTVDGIDTDVICAYLMNSSYKTTNHFVFNHILSRVGRVNTTNVAGYTDVTLTMKYRDAGRYTLKTGAWGNLGELKTKTLSLTGDNNFWIIPGTYDLTLSFKDVAGNSITKTVSQEFAAGLINNITPVLGENPDVVISTREVYEAPTFTVGSLSDIPAAGGTSGTPVVTNVQQMKHIEYTYADGHTSDGASTPVSNPSYVIVYSKTQDGTYNPTCPTYTGSNLGTTEKARTKLGNLYVRVVANGIPAVQGVEVYQQANVKTTIAASETTTAFAITLNPSTVKAAGGTVSVTGARSWSRTAVKYTYTSGASSGGEVTTGTTPMTSGFSVSANSTSNLTINGTTLTVAPNTSTTSGRSWIITGTYDGKSGTATLTQNKKSSWDVGDDDSGEGGDEEGDY